MNRVTSPPSMEKEMLVKVSARRVFGTMLKTYTADPVKWTATAAGSSEGQ